MKREYDFRKSVPNPFAKHFSGLESVLVDTSIVRQIRQIASTEGVNYQLLVNLFLQQGIDSSQARRRQSKRKPANVASHKAVQSAAAPRRRAA